MKCELCEREIIAGEESTHHLIPKAKNGNNGPTAIMHEVCHKQIHALFSNKELSMFYNTVDKLKAHKDVQRFIRWIQKRPIDFNAKTRIRRKNR